MKKTSPQLVVQEHDPIKRGILLALFVVVLIASGYLLYDYGHSRADYDFGSLETQREELRQQVTALQGEAEQLRNELVADKRSTEIERHAYTEVNKTLQKLQAEILELKEEVAFYRSIVAPRESARGLRIQRFNVMPTGVDKTYRYKLVLTQVIKNNQLTRGTVEMQLEGLSNGKPQSFNLVSLSAKGETRLDFRFKYYQNFEGDVVLPDGFVPSRIHIKVDSNKINLEKTFDWPRKNAAQRNSLRVTAS